MRSTDLDRGCPTRRMCDGEASSNARPSIFVLASSEIGRGARTAWLRLDGLHMEQVSAGMYHSEFTGATYGDDFDRSSRRRSALV